MLQLKNPDEYMVLQTKGFVEDESEIASASPRIWVSLIYQLPPSADPNLPSISLGEMIPEHDAPVLGQRFELARKLARSLLLFHTSRWLHESLHPKKILSFRTESQAHGSAPSLDHPFIGGFEYSRGPLDQSERQKTERSGSTSTSIHSVAGKQPKTRSVTAAISTSTHWAASCVTLRNGRRLKIHLASLGRKIVGR